ncbi:hypothetical protein [Levilactobacillus tongjiangensis]|uniref:Surface layer protein A domain-containing protein n=1 Tax=Levilactobacillus tongjiangensis TaxID=2486023 RepID=A0ABW1SQI6_9LACO|nr:hypothetical protein [Levilactobacillus tongjiangensis]
MQLRQRLLIATLLALGLLIGPGSSVTAHAKYKGHSQTPTELRGTWYQYQGHHKWTKIKITKYKVIYNGKALYSTKKKGSQRLFVKKYKKGNGGVNYLLNGKYKYGYQTMGNFWLSKKKVHGKRIMKSYYNMGYFQAYTRTKLAHNYSYQYDGADYMNKIGR